MQEMLERFRVSCSVAQAMQQAVVADGRLQTLAYYAATAGVAAALETCAEDRLEIQLLHMPHFPLSAEEAPLQLRAGQEPDSVAMCKVWQHLLRVAHSGPITALHHCKRGAPLQPKTQWRQRGPLLYCIMRLVLTSGQLRLPAESMLVSSLPSAQILRHKRPPCLQPLLFCCHGCGHDER